MFPGPSFQDWLAARVTAAGFPTWNPGDPANSGAVRYERHGFVPPTPDRVVTVTPGPGPEGPDEELTIIRWSVQLHVRGKQDDATDAELLMGACDDALLAIRAPVNLGTRTMYPAQYLSGAPSVFQMDAGRRYAFVGNYVVPISRLDA